MVHQILTAAVLLISVVLYATAQVPQVPIPSRPLGFVYKNGSHSAPIHIDAFIDLECPNCKMEFPVVEHVADMYGPSVVRLKFFIFPLPYHRNSIFASIATQIIASNPTKGRKADDVVADWVQLAFANQAKWSDAASMKLDYDGIRTLIASYTKSLGYNTMKFKQMMMNSTYDMRARVEWKYGCSKGVAGTPWFFINGVYFGADASWTVEQWKKAIDALLKSNA